MAETQNQAMANSRSPPEGHHGNPAAPAALGIPPNKEAVNSRWKHALSKRAEPGVIRPLMDRSITMRLSAGRSNLEYHGRAHRPMSRPIGRSVAVF